MQNEIIGLYGIGALVVMLLLRMPIGISLIAVSFSGIWATVGLRPAWGLLTAVPYDFAAKWTLSAIPMFLLMGYICFHSGLTRGLFDACRVWLVRLPGGLAVTSVFASAGFASVTGSSIACAAAMGALIPPSILLILYGIFVQVPINQLFVGGTIIGIITALSYVLIIIGRVLYNPQLAPRIDETPPMRERITKLLDTWPIVILVLLVLGGMFSGLFTATEAAAVGALLAFIFAAIRRQLTKEAAWRSIIDTLSTTGTLFIISVGANLLTRFLALTGTSELIASTIIGLELSGVALLVGITFLYLILGMFLEPLGAMLLTLPVLLPILDKANIDLIWFGIFLVKLLEVGMITPPIGINVFVIKSAVGDLASLGTIFRGVLWFIVADLVVIALIIAVPEIITYLPSLMTN